MTTFQYKHNVDRTPLNGRRTNFISHWVDTDTLSRLVQKAVAEANWGQLGPLGLPFPQSERNATFLGILTCSYALGIYPTRDIIQRLVRDKGGTALALMGLNASTLRRFRRSFRPLLTQCLAKVLEAMAENSGRWMALSHTVGRETFAAEAQRRIELAVDWDADPFDFARR